MAARYIYIKKGDVREETAFHTCSIGKVWPSIWAEFTR